MDEQNSIDPKKAGRYRRRDDLSVTIVENDAFIVDPKTQGIFHLNAVGRAIWGVLANAVSAGDVISVIAAAFPDTPPETIEADVLAFLTRMEQRNLIARPPEDAA